MTSVPNLARRVPAISFNVVNATRSLRFGSCVTPVGTRFRQRGPHVSSNGAVRRIGIGTQPDDTLGVGSIVCCRLRVACATWVGSYGD